MKYIKSIQNQVQNGDSKRVLVCTLVFPPSVNALTSERVTLQLSMVKACI